MKGTNMVVRQVARRWRKLQADLLKKCVLRFASSNQLACIVPQIPARDAANF